MTFEIHGRPVGDGHPTYFVADIAANHDGDLQRALRLIRIAAEAGADAAKFQNFTAERIVSDYGFRHLGGKLSHQAAWSKSVVEVYREASLPAEWTPHLRDACEAKGIAYFSAPYDLEAIDELEPYVSAYKVGSGDITWLESIEKMARKDKPVLLATGASHIGEVRAAVERVLSCNGALCLMQCNTNYTGSSDNLDYINLRVLETFRVMFPGVVLGLSDHTAGHATVLGAVALGAKIVEKHFTDDTRRVGPDHSFSLDADAWAAMVQSTRELERALGGAVKRVEANERETVVVQRRCLRAARALPEGHEVSRADVAVLRPATPGALEPVELERLLGRTLRSAVAEGEHLRWEQFS